MDAELREALGRALGAPVTQARPVTGGDINDAWAVRCGDGRAFVKARAGAEPHTFSAAATGLG
ncbi:MAG: fructosamine kinase family protein [Myxococcales bacterium]|nr:fructosamine kinase family protein [Myxococcales bacterium]